MELLVIRHAEPVRVTAEESGGAPADPELTGAWSRPGGAARRLARRGGRRPRGQLTAAARRPRPRRRWPPRSGSRSRSTTSCASTTPTPTRTSRSRSSASSRTTAGRRWSRVGGRTSVARHPTCSAPASSTRLDALITEHPGERVAVVCHGGVINVYLAALLGIDRHLWFDPGYTSISRVRASRAGARSVGSINELGAPRRPLGPARRCRMTVTIETIDAVTVVTIDRPEARNAVDRPTAAALADAFRAFEADAAPTRRRPHRRARHVLRRCRPEGVRHRTRQLREHRRRRPDGPDPHGARQAGDRRGRGLRRRRRAGARAVVRPAGDGERRDVRRVLPPLGRAVDRRRHGAAPPPDRPLARARPDPHRAGRSAPRRRWRSGSPTASSRRARRARPRSRSPPRSRASRRRACGSTGSRPTTSGR